MKEYDIIVGDLNLEQGKVALERILDRIPTLDLKQVKKCPLQYFNIFLEKVTFVENHILGLTGEPIHFNCNANMYKRLIREQEKYFKNKKHLIEPVINLVYLSKIGELGRRITHLTYSQEEISVKDILQEELELEPEYRKRFEENINSMEIGKAEKRRLLSPYWKPTDTNQDIVLETFLRNSPFISLNEVTEVYASCLRLEKFGRVQKGLKKSSLFG
jgi:hypothetical protein